ncbi:uncharacterized protein LACBIDRAFT_307961 [Laccaria bicolor S238N-H82]|uniref:Predicted protein n=1 Tax=Laccaria bicolor (strain S238N-H82 / ATCC MYA-4686) TaxID=486041 RepID=B0DRA9_LACBS|nr:uncharacterized protein LACBIDRAFT_307961 [Laccaria bicolor S238N-H82]EDR02839.1 predicted protein [Laccaria bicolor S238N-H82]|eukprot:XP_001886549.1 predicted protein [Laccaria bicolor S238N-H82]
MYKIAILGLSFFIQVLAALDTKVSCINCKSDSDCHYDMKCCKTNSPACTSSSRSRLPCLLLPPGILT